MGGTAPELRGTFVPAKRLRQFVGDLMRDAMCSPHARLLVARLTSAATQTLGYRSAADCRREADYLTRVGDVGAPCFLGDPVPHARSKLYRVPVARQVMLKHEFPPLRHR
jgi:hypothetical protein